MRASLIKQKQQTCIVLIISFACLSISSVCLFIIMIIIVMIILREFILIEFRKIFLEWETKKNTKLNLKTTEKRNKKYIKINTKRKEMKKSSGCCY